MKKLDKQNEELVQALDRLVILLEAANSKSLRAAIFTLFAYLEYKGMDMEALVTRYGSARDAIAGENPFEGSLTKREKGGLS